MPSEPRFQNKMGMRIIKDDALFFVPVRDLATDADAVKLSPVESPHWTATRMSNIK